jgi:protein-tyrosine phosphatase
MIDLHTHVLPGVDDGAEDLEEASAMLRMAAEDGITDVVATPHADPTYSFMPELAQQALRELADATGGVPRLHAGCELHLTFDNVQDCLANPGKYGIDGGKYVLVELPDFVAVGMVTQVLDRLLVAGLVPILAHPERNPALAGLPGVLREWTERGYLLQVTAGSLTGRFGKKAEAAANELLRAQRIHFVASDAHDTRHRPPVLSPAYEYVTKKAGSAYANLLFRENPSAVLRGTPLPEWTTTPEPQSGWRRFFSR